jgi:hypothetical protein
MTNPVRLLMEKSNPWESQGIPDITHNQQGLPSSSSRIDRPLTASEKKLKKQTQPRQLLSCNKCRERKVKVSSTIHCSYTCTLHLSSIYSVTVQSHALLVVPEAFPKNVTLFWEREPTLGLFNNRSSYGD